MTGAGAVLGAPLCSHQILIRCLWQEHPSRSLPCTPRFHQWNLLRVLIWFGASPLLLWPCLGCTPGEALPPSLASPAALCLGHPLQWMMWIEFSLAGEEAEFSPHGLCGSSDQQATVLRRRSCCSLKWWGTSSWLQALGARGVGWVSLESDGVWGFSCPLHFYFSSLTQPAVKNTFQAAGLCWCEFGDLGEFVFSTLCYRRFAPTMVKALIQIEGGK